LFDEDWIRNELAQLTVTPAISLLLKALDSITQDEGLDVWDKLSYFDKPMATDVLNSFLVDEQLIASSGTVGRGRIETKWES
jgi:hypothetical protein